MLFIDEIHRFSKTQQDSLLGAVESRIVTLVAATTENPFFSIVSPLLSRSLLLTLEPLTDDDIGTLIDRALADERGLAARSRLDADARAHLIRLSAGDARRALTALEAAAGRGDRRRKAERSSWRGSSRRSTPRRSATTAMAISTTTSSARSSSRSGVRTSTRRCTTWPG